MATGHGLFAAHLGHWKNIETECKLCTEEDETSRHWWSDCPALERIVNEIKDKDISVMHKSRALTEIKEIKEAMSQNSRWLSQEERLALAIDEP